MRLGLGPVGTAVLAIGGTYIGNDIENSPIIKEAMQMYQKNPRSKSSDGNNFTIIKKRVLYADKKLWLKANYWYSRSRCDYFDFAKNYQF